MLTNWICSASKNNQLCVTETLSSVEAATGTVTINKLVDIVSTIANGQISSLNGVNLCTACVKQIYNVAKTDFPGIFGEGDVVSNVRATCGASFVGKSIASHPARERLIQADRTARSL